MASQLLQKIVLYLIPIVALIFLIFVYYGGDEAAFNKLVNIADDAKDYIPNITIGADKLGSGQTILPQLQKQQVDSLKRAINSMLTSEHKTCFANYNGFSELGEKGVTITMTYNAAEDKTIFTFLGAAGGQQLLTGSTFEIPGMKPCVIAGSSAVVKNFDSSFLNTLFWEQKTIVANHYSFVNSISIKTDDGGYTGYTENRIDYGSGFKDFEDAGYIYTPDNEHICFFPTVDGNNVCDGSNEDGLDDDCLGADLNEDISIPRQVLERKLLTCNGDEEPARPPQTYGSPPSVSEAEAEGMYSGAPIGVPD